MALPEKQKTLRRDFAISGIGLFTGESTRVTLKPAPTHSGIAFQRVDLPQKPLIPALVDSVRDLPRTTRLVAGSGSVLMVEHLLSALRGLGVDNALIEVEGNEVPVGDGSASFWVDALRTHGLVEQGVARLPHKLIEPVYWAEGDATLVALPSSEFRVSYTYHNPESLQFRTQFVSMAIDPRCYGDEIAPCRTFSHYEEVAPLIERGMIKGGGLESAVVVRNDQVLNPGGLRFADEFARHKVLDLIGDLALIGVPFHAHILAVRSGHAAHVRFAKLLKGALIHA